MNPRIQEEIKLKMELLKALFITLLAAITGSLELLLNRTGKPIELTFIVLGFFSIFVLLIFIFLVYTKINSIIRKS